MIKINFNNFCLGITTALNKFQKSETERRNLKRKQNSIVNGTIERGKISELGNPNQEDSSSELTVFLGQRHFHNDRLSGIHSVSSYN